MPFHALKDIKNKQFVKTKVVATLGPASEDLETLKKLIQAGVDVFRLNFSHGTYDSHLKILNNIRAASKELSIPVAIMQDLCGPKMRLTAMQDDVYQKVTNGMTVELAYGDKISSSERFYLTIVDPCKILKKGERVLLHDGIIEFVVKEVKSDVVVCEVTEGGEVRSHAGIAFPDSDMNLPATTEKDLKDLEWGIANDVDYVAVSFVQNAEDITRLREITTKAGKDIHFIPKIERRVALERIDEILDVSDGVLVARGDLGVEIPVEKVPQAQRMLIKAGNKRGIPVIVATEMLQSMITENRPTRAEVTDISAAVSLGADAVMLSGETSIGKHPVTCVEYMCKIAHEIEQHYNIIEHRKEILKDFEPTSVAEAVAFATVGAAERINTPLLIAPTTSGTTARLLAKYRPNQVILAISNKPSTLRRMALYRGVRPVEYEEVSLKDPESYGRLFDFLKKIHCADDGDLAVVTGGLSSKAGTSTMHICKL